MKPKKYLKMTSDKQEHSWPDRTCCSHKLAQQKARLCTWGIAVKTGLAVSGIHLIARCSFLLLSRTDQMGNTASSRQTSRPAEWTFILQEDSAHEKMLKMIQTDFQKVTKQYMQQINK